MSLEKEIKQLLERYRDTQCGGKANKAAESLGVTPATFSRWVTGTSLPKVESLIEPFERLNARIIIGQPETGVDGECSKCQELTRALNEQELSFSKRLLEAKDEIIRLQKELRDETLKNETSNNKQVDIRDRLPRNEHGPRDKH